MFVEKKKNKNVTYKQKRINTVPRSEFMREETLANPAWIPVERAI